MPGQAWFSYSSGTETPIDGTPQHAGSNDAHNRRAASLWWLLVAALVVLLVYDWFSTGLTRALILGTARIDVVTEPPGATVLADVERLGTTPLRDARLLPGRYRLRVEHPHFLPWAEAIDVQRGDQVQRTLTLTPGFGTLRLISNPRGADIRLNGEPLDAVTPHTIEQLAAGEYHVQLSIYGRASHEGSVDVLPSQEATVNAELNRVPMGSLRVATDPPGATVNITPAPVAYEDGVRLPLGTYRVTATLAGHAAASETVSLRRGPNRVQLTLAERRGRLDLTVRPAAASVTVVAANGRSQPYDGALELPVGTTVIRARARGYRDLTRRVELSEDGLQLDLALERFDAEIGRVFSDELRDGGRAPQVVVLAAGRFTMGDADGSGSPDERPARTVQLRAPFAIGVHEVTRADWARFRGGDATLLPVTRVSRSDIAGYLRWLGQQTGARYRLPSEAEWEFAARAGDTGSFPGGGDVTGICRHANVADADMGRIYDWETVPCSDGYQRMAPVGQFAANAFGLHDTLGNAAEWVADCWYGDHSGAYSDGRVRGGNCSNWVERGGAWDSAEAAVRLSSRAPAPRPNGDRGFRVVREL